jgi:FkbM family methyltransferase
VIRSAATPVIDRLVRLMVRRRIRGVRSLQNLVGWLTTTSAVTAKTRYGSRFQLYPSDYIDAIVLREGYYESEVLEALAQDLPPGAVVWDVGANFGLHGVTLKVLRPDVRVVCFEPSPTSAARVLTNAELNSVAVDLISLGLGEAAGLRKLHVVSRGNPGMTTTTPWGSGHYDRELVCFVETGARLVATGVVPAPTAVKIDVEGAERSVLAGMADLLAGPGVRRIVIEGDDNLARAVSEYGYRVVALDRNEASRHALNNYLATK